MKLHNYPYRVSRNLPHQFTKKISINTQIYLIYYYHHLHFHLRCHIRFHKHKGLTILPPLKKIRPRISFNRSHLLDKLGYIYTNSISLRKISRKSIATRIPSKIGTFLLLSNTYAKISCHPFS